jgi:hypothetical protein
MAWQENLNGVSASAPSAVRLGSTTVIFIRGVDGRLWFKRRVGNSFTADWIPEPSGILTSAPAVVAISGTSADIFIKGSDNALWTNRYNDSGQTFVGWTSLGQNFDSTPAVCARVMERCISCSAMH